MTLDEFYEVVQRDGFPGLVPGKNDILGDHWAHAIGEEFDRVAVDVPPGAFRHQVWLVFQWIYCELAGMRSRIIASPPACRAAGYEVGPDVVDKALRLLIATTKD